MTRRTFIDDLAARELLDELTPERSVEILAAAAVDGVRACRRCGCTDERACPGGCHWVAADLCSTCA